MRAATSEGRGAEMIGSDRKDIERRDLLESTKREVKMGKRWVRFACLFGNKVSTYIPAALAALGIFYQAKA